MSGPDGGPRPNQLQEAATPNVSVPFATVEPGPDEAGQREVMRGAAAPGRRGNSSVLFVSGVLAASVGFVAGWCIGFGVLLVLAIVFPNPSFGQAYLALAVPLVGSLIASVVTYRRSGDRLVRSAAVGTAVACVFQLMLYAGGG